MPSPKLYTVYEQNMTERINEYYGNSSVFKNNMFYVGLWGEYVDSAVSTMEASAKKDPFLNIDRRQSTKGVYTFENSLNRWKNTHWTPENTEVELKWKCKSIKIPTVESQIAEGQQYSIDSIKPIVYPLISDYGGIKTVTLTIVEDRNMMMWHFFNTLHNQFYDTQILKPKSSFHKVGMYCAVLQGDNLASNDISTEESNQGVITEDGATREQIITDVPAMVYEFNSAVVTKISDIELNHENPGMLTFSVTIQVPNTFQGTFKTSFRGLANNTTQGGYSSTSIIDSNGIPNGGYNGLDYSDYNNPSLFESNLNSSSSGSGLDFKRNPNGSITNQQGSNTTKNTNRNSNVLNRSRQNLR